MRIAFCTTCKGRAEHVKQTLPKNLADNADYPNAVFVVLDYDSPDDLGDYLRTNHADDITSGRLVVYSYRNGGAPFHVAHAKNMAARCALREGAELLVTQDADNFTGPEFAQFAADSLKEPSIRRNSFLAPDWATLPRPGQPGRPPRGFAGRLALAAQTFIKAGGYDETYATWRGEDMDLSARLDRMGYQLRPIDTKYLDAIPHSSGVRFKDYPHAQQYEKSWRYEQHLIRTRKETVVNYGKFGLGTVYRNFDPTPIELTPLPTRVFGIGLQRTGTTSLDAAFKILGFDSFHWGTGEAPLIWQEMQALGRSKILEQWYALSDMPIPLLYRELDKAYPGSKFVLTVRNEADWLKSVERLWDPKFNPDRWLWDVYPFTNHIHTVLYGQKDFMPLVFLDRYRRHNGAVLDYFHDRPGDLLVLDMDMGGEWPSLCKFLDRPIPDIPYPRMNGSKEISYEQTEYSGEPVMTISTTAQRRFGRLPPAAEKVVKTLKLKDYLTADLPAATPPYNALTRVFAALGTNDVATLFPMDGNDTVGNCTIAALAHASTVFNGLVGVRNVMTAAQCTELYFQLTGGADSGLDCLTVLNYWKAAAVNGEKILGYAAVDVTNKHEVKQAIQLFGGVYVGFQVQMNCVNEFDWNQWWKPGPLTADGHCPFVIGFDKFSVQCLTWGGLQHGSWGWWGECVEEAYVILPPQATSASFAPGFNFAQLQADLAAL